MKACIKCGTEDDGARANDKCWPCFEIAQDAWIAKMAIRQDPAQFDMQRLVGLLLTQHWMHECEIITDYMPPFPRDDTQPRCVVAFVYDDGSKAYLRHSRGPLQGWSWDIYGDDLHDANLALVAISSAPAPPRIDYCIPTHGQR